MPPVTKRILVVDDDPDMCALIEDTLVDEGYTIQVCWSGEQARALLGQTRFDLVLADIRMPRITGMELLREVRTGCAQTKVILMTAYASVDTAVEALRRQADDFLVKPFALAELCQRVREALPVEQEPAGVFLYRDLIVDVNARRTWLEERELQLTRQEYGVLACLVERQGCIVPWQELVHRVWGCSDPSRRDLGNLRSCIRRLREKLGDNARDPRYIVTRWGEGYQLGQ